MTREQLREACAQAADKYRVALQDDWTKALPRLFDEVDAIYDRYAAAKAASKPEPSRRARK